MINGVQQFLNTQVKTVSPDVFVIVVSLCALTRLKQNEFWSFKLSKSNTYILIVASLVVNDYLML